MKPKYHGIFTFFLFIAALVAVSGYIYSGLWELPQSEPDIKRTPHPDIKVPTAEEVKTMQRLSETLENISIPKEKPGGGISLALFGHHPYLLKEPGDDETDSQDAGEKLSLSLTVMAGTTRFCIIDGIFFTEGAILPDGAKITRIESQRVRLTKENIDTWLWLKENELQTGVPPNNKGKGSS